MRNEFPSTAKIAARLLKSFYGHPLAGKLWQDHLSGRLRGVGGIELAEHPFNWIFRVGDQVLLLHVYVDDLTLAGKTSLHAAFWKLLREVVKLDPETEVGIEGGRILGRLHRITGAPGLPHL